MMRKTTISHAGMPSVGVQPGSRADRAHTRHGRAVVRDGKAGKNEKQYPSAFFNEGDPADTRAALLYQQGQFGEGK